MILIGTGRIGGALAHRASQRGVRCVVLTRDSGWDALETIRGPIFVAVRTTDLDTVLARIPQHRLADLILIQNGMLSPWLEQRGYGMVTRGVLYMAVPKRGAQIQMGDPSPFFGPNAVAVTQWFNQLDVPAVVVESASFQQIEVEKLLWNCVFGLMCAVTGESVGRLCDSRESDIQRMTRELITVAAKARGVQLDPVRVVQGMLQYSYTISEYTGRVSDWPFRNGWFVEASNALGVLTPTHDLWVSRLQD